MAKHVIILGVFNFYFYWFAPGWWLAAGYCSEPPQQQLLSFLLDFSQADRSGSTAAPLLMI